MANVPKSMGNKSARESLAKSKRKTWQKEKINKLYMQSTRIGPFQKNDVIIQEPARGGTRPHALDHVHRLPEYPPIFSLIKINIHYTTLQVERGNA